MNTWARAVSALALGVFMCMGCASCERPDVVVGSKHFTEQKILGHMVAELVERNTDLTVGRTLGLQGTKVCFGAIRNDEIDIYPEYTGTGLVNLLERDYNPSMTKQDILELVRRQFKSRWNLVWMEPLGFNNTYAYCLREKQARELGIETISDLEQYKDRLKPGFDHEYTQRPEYRRFSEVYGFDFQKGVTRLSPDLTYKALEEKSVDVIDAFATDGRIDAYGFKVLKDDQGLFPPYDACLLVRQGLLEKHPRLRELLGKLSGKISAEEMRTMNYAVTDKQRAPDSVARAFLKKEGLL